jgi:hypothetical protein
LGLDLDANIAKPRVGVLSQSRDNRVAGHQHEDPRSQYR